MNVYEAAQKYMPEAVACGTIIRRQHEATYRMPGAVSNRPALTITDGMPEAGGGASISAAPAPAEADDDDGGDPEPEPERQSIPSITSPRAARRNATATAGAPDPSPPTSDLALWRLPTVLQHVPVSRSGWWAGVKSGRYPAPIKLSPRCVAWRASDIRKLINSL